MSKDQLLVLLGCSIAIPALANDAPELTIHIGGNESFVWDAEPIPYIVVASDSEDGDSLSGELSPYSVAVEALHVAEAYAAFEPELAEAGLILGATRGRQLVEADDCFLCHLERADGPTAVPTYAAIAERYQGNLGVAPALARNIVSGTQGLWGNMLMPAHEASEDEATAMALYVLSFGDETSERALLPVVGSVTPALSGALREGPFGPELDGRYLLAASYLDNGSDSGAPATGTAVHAFRYPNVPATELDIVSGFRTQRSDGVSVLVSEGAATARLADVDLTGIRNVSIAGIGSADQWPGGAIELRLDAPDGELAGRLELGFAGPTLATSRSGLRLGAVSGRHDVFLVVVTEEPVAIGAICFDCEY